MSTIVITGASSGVGRAAALELGAQGHEVVVVGRNPERTAEVAERVGGASFTADFSSLADVRRLAAELRHRYERIDVLANNAGAFNRKRITTDDGVELTWEANVLAPFVLSAERLPALQGGRVIFTSSVANRSGRIHHGNPSRIGLLWAGGWPAYGASKRADAMLGREFSRRTGVDSYSFHPGFIATRFANLHDSPFTGVVARVAKTPEEGAAPLVFLATAENPGVPAGTYFDGMSPNGALAAQARDDAECAKLWDALELQAAGIR
ncbi:MAG: SDR family NAD(P)-dependent oxidoreductase [Micrococcales bacterium]|nr:SDR family NAD(P)-dependent oxidoreductase [Micrococcales bacterium]